jgi:hypothetical protein
MLPNSSSHILLQFDEEGNHVVSEISSTGCRQIEVTLHELGERYLNLADTSLDNILRYLVTPEMEVERIFNCLRFKYLSAIYLSGFIVPDKYISSRYNKSFQTLAGLKVYQGAAKERKDNDAFWQDAGFTVSAREQNWQKERDEMQTILSLIKRLSLHSVTSYYAELIAIKPGFHELYVHDDYFESDTIPDASTPRSMVFRMLRNKEDITSLELSVFPSEINKNSYFSYAPCTVTEGPFVFRKSVSVSYFDSIRGITTKKQIRTLQDKFHILDYYHADLSSRSKLGQFLEKATPFCSFIT